MKKSILKNSVLVVMLFLMPSCNNEDAPTVENTDNTRKEITLSRAEQELSAHCTDFAFRLLQEMNKEKMLALYRDGYEDGIELMPKLKAFLEEE